MLKSIVIGSLMLGQAGGLNPSDNRPPPEQPVWQAAALEPAPLALAQEPGKATAADPAPAEPPKPVDITAPILPPPAATPAEEAAAEEATAATRYFFMREVQGTYVGAFLDDHRTSVSGWFAGSYTESLTPTTNQPVVWNDRSDKFLLQQAWLRIERSTVTSGTTSPTAGFRVDLLYGTDYRFTILRGLFNSQAENADGVNNLYGLDPIQFYVNAYFPTIFQGLDVRAGRLYTPFGYESVEAVSTPLISRSYAFNFCPPFTHMGVQATATISPQWTAKVMLANGNDVWFVPEQEPRVVGAVTYTHPNKKDVFTFGYTLGRGKFNTGSPFNPPTVGILSEPAGRNNINVLDFVYTHAFSDRLSYGLEVIYGYQYGVPSNALVDAGFGGIVALDRTHGTAHWGSIVNYLNYQLCPKWKSVSRFEVFDDFEGQRTGFEGVYTAVTTGLVYTPSNSVQIRTEARYDNNNMNRAFAGKNEFKYDLFTAACDLIIKY